MKLSRGRNTGRPAWMAAGVGCALASLALADQLVLGWTKSDVTSHYGRFGLHPDPNVLTGILMASGLLYAGSMAVTARKQMKGRRAGSLWWAGGTAVVWTGFATLATLAHEYDGYVLTPTWRIAPWLLPATALAVAARPRRGRQ